MARSLQHWERVFSLCSCSEAVNGFLVKILAVGTLPQVQMGALGGQVQGFSKLRNRSYNGPKVAKFLVG